MTKLLRQPLLQFLVFGGLIYVAWAWVGDSVSLRTTERIVVSEAQVSRLVERWRQTWRREPSEAELRGLVDDFVKEEVYYREALAMGLDRDDDVIRRRLRQKIELLSEDLSQSVAPTDPELQAFLDENVDDYRLDPRATFVQVYVSVDRRGDDAKRYAEELLAELRSAGSAAAGIERGDPIPLPSAFGDAAEREVASAFGPEFASSVMGLAPGAWRGPVRSGYGLHLVYVEERQDGREPTLDEVRAAVSRDFLFQRRSDMDAALFESLRQRYEITVEGPEGSTPVAEGGR